MTEEKELTPIEKLQAEYNQTCAQLGHARSQIIMLSEDEVNLQERIKKIRNKLNNLPKDKEVKDGTETQISDG